jgi:hypothetical protein
MYYYDDTPHTGLDRLLSISRSCRATIRSLARIDDRRTSSNEIGEIRNVYSEHIYTVGSRSA